MRICFIVISKEKLRKNLLRKCFVHIEHLSLGAVHILRQPKTGVRRPPPPLSANVSFWLTPPPPLVSFCQQLADPPSPLRQLSSAFGKRPICTTNFTEDFLK